MLFLLQLALGLAFFGYLVVACFDFVRGMYYVLTGLALLAVGLTQKGVAFVLKKIHPAPAPVAPPVVIHRVPTWKFNAP